jgi:hypothetical protein
LCLVIFTALTLYGSLYPWEPRDSKLGPSAWTILTSAYWFRLGLGFRADVLLNVLFYVPFGLFGVWSLSPQWPLWRRVLLATLCGGILSLGVEVAQFHVSSRVTSPADLLMNVIGTALGALVAGAIVSRRSWPALIPPILLASCGVASVVLNLWIGNRADLVKLIAISLCLLWSLRTRNRGPFALLLAFVFYEQLRPFDYAVAPQEFDWRPLVASISGSGLARAATFTFKLFFYGSTLMAAIRSGMPPVRTALAVGGLLLGLEYVQRWMPSRTPEITDGLVPLLWAILFPGNSRQTPLPQRKAGSRPRAIV